MRATLLVIGLICVAVSTGLAPGQSAGDETVRSELLIVLQPSSVEIRGAISSAANEKILRETASRLYADRAVAIEVGIQSALPPGWALVTDLTLQALAQTSRATAAVRPDGVSIRGFTNDRAAWRSAAGRISGRLPVGWELDYQVEEKAAAGAMNRQCIEMFRTATRGRPIDFERASAELGTAALPLLDELIQIAVDCPGAQIDVTGHTDNTGAESANMALSRQRAEAVADYLVMRGIAATRVNATGVGSSRPLVDENTAQARRLNRRIELSLEFPAEN